jgi:hypothetical protein
MTTTTERELRVAGIGAAIRSAAGPSLSGTLELAIAVTVSDPDGKPLGGLSRDNFTVSVLLAEGSTATARAVMSSVTEPLAGVYVLKLDRRLAELRRPIACVIDVVGRVETVSPPTLGRALMAIES